MGYGSGGSRLEFKGTSRILLHSQHQCKALRVQEESRAGIVIQDPVVSQLGEKMIPEEEFVNLIMTAEVCPDFQSLIFMETLDQKILVGFDSQFNTNQEVLPDIICDTNKSEVSQENGMKLNIQQKDFVDILQHQGRL